MFLRFRCTLGFISYFTAFERWNIQKQSNIRLNGLIIIKKQSLYHKSSYSPLPRWFTEKPCNVMSVELNLTSSLCHFLQPAAEREAGCLLIPIINSWLQWIDATECQATDFCTVVHRLNSSLLSFVPISLPDSIPRSPRPAFSRSHLLPLTLRSPLSLLAPFFIILFLCYCLSPPCPFL